MTGRKVSPEPVGRGRSTADFNPEVTPEVKAAATMSTLSPLPCSTPNRPIGLRWG